MATNAYLERMGELEAQTRKKQDDFLQSSGLPISRPRTEQPNSVPSGQSPKPDGEDESYKDSTFYQNFDNFQKNDPYFGGVVKELTDLATGLRDQVKNGYMPQQIAEQRLHQFVQDTSTHYQKNEKPLAEKANQEKQQAEIMGIIGQFVGNPQQQQPQGTPPEGITADEAMQSQAEGGQDGE